MDARERQWAIDDAIENGFPQAAGMLAKAHECLSAIENERSLSKPGGPIISDNAAWLPEHMRAVGGHAAKNG